MNMVMEILKFERVKGVVCLHGVEFLVIHDKMDFNIEILKKWDWIWQKKGCEIEGNKVEMQIDLFFQDLIY